MYIVKVGNMYLEDIDTSEYSSENEFIRHIELTFVEKNAKKFEEYVAKGIATKIYLVLGAKCEIIQYIEPIEV